jgi:Fur family transcriptional regulator, peroxide stress response regulator
MMAHASGQSEIAGLLREHGLRVTPQRVAICALLLDRHHHYTPHQVHEALRRRFPSLSPNTVYLTLDQLEAAGLVQRVHVEGQSVFDSNTRVHDHLYCQRCGLLADVPAAAAPPKAPPQPAGWRVDHASRTLFGLCPACRGKGAAA